MESMPLCLRFSERALPDFRPCLLPFLLPHCTEHVGLLCVCWSWASALSGFLTNLCLPNSGLHLKLHLHCYLFLGTFPDLSMLPSQCLPQSCPVEPWIIKSDAWASASRGFLRTNLHHNCFLFSLPCMGTDALEAFSEFRWKRKGIVWWAHAERWLHDQQHPALPHMASYNICLPATGTTQHV